MAYSFILFLLFLLGASVGSFLSVVIFRIQKNKGGIIFGNSFCPSCKKKLTSRDLIPILSFLLSRGKCRHCQKGISPYYLLLEISTGILFLAVYLHFPFLGLAIHDAFIFNTSLFIPFFFYTLYSVFFIAIFFYDLQTSKIPDIFLFSLLGASIVGTLIMGSPEIWNIFVAITLALVFYGGQIVLSKGKWLGEGDLYFALSLAVIFGWELFLVSTVVSYFIGAIVSTPLLIFKKVKKSTSVPFAPFLVIGAFITLFFGNELLSWYVQTLIV